MASDPKFANVNFTAFFVFIGTAMSITAFPVLARILRETGLIYTRSGSMAMGAAAFNDAVAWCLLILAISIANAGDMSTAGLVFLSVCAFALGLFFLVGPLFSRLVRHIEATGDPSMQGNLFCFTMILVFLCGWTTDLLGVHFIFGAFLFGLIVPRETHLIEMCENKIGEFVMTILLPLYFALSGLKTDVTQLTSGTDGAMVILVCFVATVGKVVGAGAPAYISGLPLRESSVVAVLMNTRGLVELIVLNLGLTSCVLNTKCFTVMVLMALFTTFLTCPVIYCIYPPHMRALDEQKINLPVDEETPLSAAPARHPLLDASGALSLQRFETLALCVLVERVEQLPAIMSLLFMFAPAAEGSRLGVHAIRLVEPTKRYVL